MTYKRPFKFDFDEDADPVEELHRLRVATAKHFKTPEAISAYYRSTPPIEVLMADLDKEIAEKRAKEEAAAKAKTARIRTPKAKVAKTAKTSKTGKAPAHAGRRKTAKRLTPA